MLSRTLAGVAAMAVGAIAGSVSTAYTDSNCGITFQQMYDDDTTFSMGIALPESPSTDFIGQIVSDTNTD